MARIANGGKSSKSKCQGWDASDRLREQERTVREWNPKEFKEWNACQRTPRDQRPGEESPST